jgi:hypothetical protein
MTDPWARMACGGISLRASDTHPDHRRYKRGKNSGRQGGRPQEHDGNLLAMYMRQDVITRSTTAAYKLSGFRDAPREARILDCGCAIGVSSHLSRRWASPISRASTPPRRWWRPAASVTQCEIRLRTSWNLMPATRMRASTSFRVQPSGTMSRPREVGRHFPGNHQTLAHGACGDPGTEADGPLPDARMDEPASQSIFFDPEVSPASPSSRSAATSYFFANGTALPSYWPVRLRHAASPRLG